jgi:asparagine synthase (glutamine-hydrolysing)
MFVCLKIVYLWSWREFYLCGINGFSFSDLHQAEIMNKAIKYRGPDDEGVFADSDVTLGHVRLAILDLSKAGKQPMIYERNGRWATIVFNGEIYNFEPIRQELENKGYAFNSRTDTEVILASYLEWGFDCVNHFNGMWAFAIYDRSKRILFCSRDRLGVKPFHYFLDEDKFIFSSELKGILTHANLSLSKKENINVDALNLYFTLGYIPAPHTIYNNVYKLEARQNIVFDLKFKKSKKWYYYKIPKYAPENNSKKLIEDGRELLKDAVRLRMIADVPIGAFLSGGLDSTTTVGVMSEFTDVKNLHTFSIGFEGKYDETPFVNIAKEYFHSKHHHSYFTQADFEKLIGTYAYIFDEPLADYSGFPTLTLSKMTREYVTVALSGDGGDEIFGGYPVYVAGYRMHMIRKTPRFLRVLLSKIPANENLNGYVSLYLLKDAFRLSLYDPSFFFANALETDLYLPEIYKEWTKEKLKLCIDSGADNFADVLRLYDLMFNTLPDNYLEKVDKASMAYALEVRSPFLDYRFVEFAQRIPTELKVDLFKSKKLLKELTKGIVPDEILRRKKRGFVPPLQDWILDEKYAAFLQQTADRLNELDPELSKFFNEKALRKNNKLYGLYKIRLFLFGVWFEKWINKSDLDILCLIKVAQQLNAASSDLNLRVLKLK